MAKKAHKNKIIQARTAQTRDYTQTPDFRPGNLGHSLKLCKTWQKITIMGEREEAGAAFHYRQEMPTMTHHKVHTLSPRETRENRERSCCLMTCVALKQHLGIKAVRTAQWVEDFCFPEPGGNQAHCNPLQ